METTATLERETATVANKSDDRGGKYLVFHLGREEFGIRVLKVREIMGIQDITAVPHTPRPAAIRVQAGLPWKGPRTSSRLSRRK